MIEVEKKLKLEPGQEEKLLAGAEFLQEVRMEDVYYDTPELSLATKDWWLRSRNGRWELKIPLHTENMGTRMVDRYREMDDDDEIRQALGIEKTHDLARDLATAGYEIFVPLVTTRKKYKRDNFSIDLDVMDFGYTLAEVEVMVPTEDKMESAMHTILDFAQGLGISVTPVQGKVTEYLRRKKPEQYQRLVDAGVISSTF